MFDIVLYQPEIPPNTGNAIRLCANAGARLHLVKPLGFQLTDRAMTRAGLDYHELADVTVHESWAACAAALAGKRLFAATTRGRTAHDAVRWKPGDVMVFGPETRGLPAELIDGLPEAQRIRIPMREGARSLNLSNSVAIVLYEAWRQNGFAGAGGRDV